MSWTLPADGVLTSPYGPRSAPVAGGSTFHRGVDIAPRAGQQDRTVRSVGDGVVLSTASSDVRGYYVRVRHDDQSTTHYQHLAGAASVAAGQRVSTGTPVGVMGATGVATGVHLHFETFPPGAAVDGYSTNAVDPEPFMLDRGVSLEAGTAPPITEPPTDPEDDMTQLMLVREEGTPGVFITDLVSRRHVISNTHLAILQRRLDRWGIDSAIVDVADLRAYGPEIPFA
ncbi:M23 family metallopeptidase [Cellulomonas sp. SLBN-39]|uniref:M23 family metallopeptidase n=1 Tax=Cellulomonas sp. SLBN-39 TaxID=2768446 RepID=UPI00114FA376|nr:M23 family metallopeptidase [Cellulomonas sp. SLBN-39]TQL03496.1 peptidase M23-like protein [Cellulomonas sp. SLBN-39]